MLVPEIWIYPKLVTFLHAHWVHPEYEYEVNIKAYRTGMLLKICFLSYNCTIFKTNFWNVSFLCIPAYSLTRTQKMTSVCISLWQIDLQYNSFNEIQNYFPTRYRLFCTAFMIERGLFTTLRTWFRRWIKTTSVLIYEQWNLPVDYLSDKSTKWHFIRSKFAIISPYKISLWITTLVKIFLLFWFSLILIGSDYPA